MAPKLKSQNLGDISFYDGDVLMWDGKQHIGVALAPANNNITSFRGEGTEWARWDHNSCTMEVLLKGQRHTIDPQHIIGKHPLDVGAGTTYEKEHRDLAVIREKYEAMVKLEPTLADLRRDYDDLLEKYKIIDALSEDNDA